MKKITSMALAAVFATGLLGCTEDAPAPEPTPEPIAEPAKPAAAEVPAYEPTGDHAAVKKAAAEGITADNAPSTATELEAELQRQIAALESND
jgi:hypothetical protein